MAYARHWRMSRRPAGMAAMRATPRPAHPGPQGAAARAGGLSDCGRGIPPGPGRRTLDIVLSLIALVLLWPLLMAIAVAVCLTSPGPVIFRHPRCGQGGRPFMLYKFRSMRNGSAGPGITLLGDARVTRVGHFLRATSLDELPQIVNVLRGDMTLVGPRPESIELARQYPRSLTSVFCYRPGLTGPTQLQMRDPIEVDEADAENHYLNAIVPLRIELDMAYLARPTLWRTAVVIWQTAAYLLLKSSARLRETHSNGR
jgi:lipopolysaccharide/colanic/teichoic acid biosynthesis glycosyltransferase